MENAPTGSGNNSGCRARHPQKSQIFGRGPVGPWAVGSWAMGPWARGPGGAHGPQTEPKHALGPHDPNGPTGQEPTGPRRLDGPKAPNGPKGPNGPKAKWAQWAWAGPGAQAVSWAPQKIFTFWAPLPRYSHQPRRAVPHLYISVLMYSSRQA